MTILLVEDDPDDAMIVKDILDESSGSRLIYLFEHVNRLAAGFEYLARETPDLILLDLNLPDSRGLETVERMHAGFPDIPIVVLTGLADEEAGLAAVRKGAQDYLVKGEISAHLLARAVLYAVERDKLVKEVLSAKNRIKILQGLLPICSFCKKIRGDQGYWEQLEGYISKHSEADFSHGLCPECATEHYPEFFKKLKK